MIDSCLCNASDYNTSSALVDRCASSAAAEVLPVFATLNLMTLYPPHDRWRKCLTLSFLLLVNHR